MTSLGGGPPPHPAPVPTHFDALLYLEESPKMHSLAWPICQ